MDDKKVIELLYQYGHFWNPSDPNGWSVRPAQLALLDMNHRIVQDALASYQHFMGIHVSGYVGPATLELLNAERCGMPDYPDPAAAIGSGGWPQPCQKGGVKVHFNKSGMPASVVPRWDEIVRKVFAAYADIGLRLVEVATAAEANIYQTWERLAGSTIGLAQFNNESCSDRVFCKLDPGYTQHVASLLAHEIGHNCNLNHRSQGGIMHPSIRPDPEPFTWRHDPSYPDLDKMYGGDPIETIPGPPAPPVPGPSDLVLWSGSLTAGNYQLVRKGAGRPPITA